MTNPDQCKVHRTYTAKFPPRVDCPTCWEQWLRKDPKRLTMMRTVVDYVRMTPGIFRYK